MQNKFYFITLIIILTIALFLRLYNLSNNPYGFFGDEASIGYNAYSILTTGKDEFGVRFPLFFRAFGEFKNPLDIYATVPLVGLFGLNEFSVRLTSVIFSIATIIFLYLLGWALQNRTLGILLSGIYAITPWNVHLSRTNMEGMQILLFLLMGALLYWIRFNQSPSQRNALFVTIFCAAALYSYFPARIIIPIFFTTFLLSILYKKRWKSFFLGLLVFCILAIPMGYHMFSQQGLNRWKQVTVFNATASPVKKFLISYFYHFSPDYLFFKGDIGMRGQFITRHSVRGLGQLFVWQAPFIVLGMYMLFKKQWKILALPLLTLLFVYPIPSSITAEIPPQATRSVVGLIPLTVLTGIGLYKSVFLFVNRKIASYIFLIIFTVIVTLSFGHFIIQWRSYPLYSSDYWGWQSGPREILQYFNIHADEYDEFYLDGIFNGPEIFPKFYLAHSPALTNTYIGGLDHQNNSKHQLFALRAEAFDGLEHKENYVVLSVVHYPDAKPAFYLLTPIASSAFAK